MSSGNSATGDSGDSEELENEEERNALSEVENLITTIIKFSTSDNAFRVLWLVHSISVISSYTLVWPYMVNDCVKRC